ncbi:flavodoxin FldB [Edwardsiella ictaluri]|uniref:Flavodoxin n=2 Tax=Edwardsiella ictaluri TaxID=67780 RepID=C5BAS2_EDWI9|nr:flavodoxin FldB [Edwardsiella ictaluri]ACR70481.1 flavodoxin, putative [Edwardsiella ictaluri 93-146]ARD39388.1 flavodoxin FldB [Edwardsiella ictaluri]AVZ82691.1 flavodoxin FldB [Edwardsiella ictaluri]EKS7761595.1 flavodoxin FldB [Edwardsiella ictaluri]EKS7769372.1 flavodoxin FldB [Edwardsiella ictaluri]
MKIGLFYGSSTCYTEMAAERIRDILGADLVTLHNIRDTPPALMAGYDMLIMGIPTWDFGELQEDWQTAWDALPPLPGKIVALYGMGDQQGYGEWFQDALGMLHDRLLTLGARPIGYWSTAGYAFTASRATLDDGRLFTGLALDEVNQFDLSEARLQRWCQQIMLETAGLL